ncbi:cytochrome c biogenesis protein CcsA [Mesosutterella sp. AGMB02718]|uniref:Cytochrome c biogenesis protein CcsA n=1 Tax=Mesosutterella faecium TaxID=2925194 RepID=A0ABT7IKV3_9BURK|nr:cytochrome c biogenesis protein CcsA [Mesosutterella sp. AGMB02718]MDL2058620.1 cytochrome c biogenesis protein CcsA [Mesosutterella sp. AGMB02718]
MMTGTLLTVLAALAYAGCGAVALSSLWKRGGRAPAWLLAGILAALVLHSAGVSRQIFHDGGIFFGFGPAVSASMLFAVAILSIVSCFQRIGPVFGIALIAAAAAALLPAVFPGEPMNAALWTPLFRVHLGLGLITYGLLATAIIQAVLMQLQDGRFRRSPDPIPQRGILSNLPSILSMEKVLFYMLWTGFATLTALLVTGFFVTHEAYGVWLHFDHKTFLTWASWLCCAVLLAGHRLLGWRGSTALKWCWILCAIYLVAYLGYTFLIEVFID